LVSPSSQNFSSSSLSESFGLFGWLGPEETGPGLETGVSGLIYEATASPAKSAQANRAEANVVL
jgi:hypothetical protein